MQHRVHLRVVGSLTEKWYFFIALMMLSSFLWFVKVWMCWRNQRVYSTDSACDVLDQILTYHIRITVFISWQI